MAFSASVSLSYSHPLLNPPPHSFPYLSHAHFTPFFKPLFFKPRCSINTVQTETPPVHKIDFDVQNTKKKKRKPRPSFYEEIRGKWSSRPVPLTKKLPWQQELEKEEASPEMEEKDHGISVNFELERPEVFDELINGRKTEEPIFDHALSDQVSHPVSSVWDISLGSSFAKEKNMGDTHSEYQAKKGHGIVNFGGVLSNDVAPDKLNVAEEVESCRRIEGATFVDTHFDYQAKDDQKYNVRTYSVVNFGGNSVNNTAVEELGIVEEVETAVVTEREKVDNVRLFPTKCDANMAAFGNEKLGKVEKERGKASSEGSAQEMGANRLPWMPKNDSEERERRSKTELAERTIPEHQLKRLRNVSLRMKERIAVGEAGVTQALVDEIHEKWSIDEVVKLKFEGPSKLNMKRIHDTLESKTGGLVIWRSGSSVVLYRGLTYKLGCVNTYAKEKEVDLDVSKQKEKLVLESLRLPKNLSQMELLEASELNIMLEGLGPRYVDWSGPPPLPVDADLLPSVVPGYRTPHRLLPHGSRNTLTDEETTHFRRTARNMSPHFALGRNRELQGLAAAMVKLWEKSAIAKIAIKRGVLNTNNKRMAEELKKITGGTLLSRNKEYIVFYRGNDFLPPNVTKALKEREQLAMLQYEEEDALRYASKLISSNPTNYEVPVVAGTLSETVHATSRWGKQPNSEDLEKMMKESDVARLASLLKHLQNKYAIANGKLKKAERALTKVEEFLDPEELPTDLEMITDEERLVFRKMGLSMKPHLFVGKREVFDGTIENMHLHWKFRELVKIIVRGEKNFVQVKQFAVSLETESGGVLVSIDKTTKGYAIIIYRGKNYQRPFQLRPRNLLTRRQALARSMELQRCEGLRQHILNLQEQMKLLKSELENVKNGKKIDERFLSKLGDTFISSGDCMEEGEDEEAYL